MKMKYKVLYNKRGQPMDIKFMTPYGIVYQSDLHHVYSNHISLPGNTDVDFFLAGLGAGLFKFGKNVLSNLWKGGKGLVSGVLNAGGNLLTSGTGLLGNLLSQAGNTMGNIRMPEASTSDIFSGGSTGDIFGESEDFGDSGFGGLSFDDQFCSLDEYERNPYGY